MKSTNHNKIIKELLNVFRDKTNIELAKTLEDENRASQFDRSKDFYLLMLLATNKGKLCSNYIHFLY